MREDTVSICSSNKHLLRSILALLGFDAWVFTLEEGELYWVIVVLRRRDGGIVGVQYGVTIKPRETLCNSEARRHRRGNHHYSLAHKLDAYRTAQFPFITQHLRLPSRTATPLSRQPSHSQPHSV